MRTTLLCPVYNSYLLFRANVESLLANTDFDQLLIVDDCSNDPKTVGFLEYLDNNFQNISVVQAGDPADCPQHNGHGRGVLPPGKTNLSKGQGLAINYGIQHVRTDFTFIYDSDTLFLPKSKTMFVEMEKCMDTDEQVMAVGQLAGKIDGIKIIAQRFLNWRNRPVGGFPNACAMLSRMTGWHDHRLKLLHNGGWCHEPYATSIFDNRLKTCNFNVYKDGYIIHLGAGMLRTEKPHDYAGNFAFTKDKDRKYGTLNSDGSLKDYYAGHNCIPFTTQEFIELLNTSYQNLDFSIRKNIVQGWD